MSNKHTLEGEEPPSKRSRLDEEDDSANGPSQANQERTVGITAYVSPDVPGFSCVVKQRYTDFLVNEIVPDGRVLHLIDLPESVSRRKQQKAVQESAGADAQTPAPQPTGEVSDVKQESKPEQGGDVESKAEPKVDVPELSSEDKATIEGIFGPTTTRRIIDLHAAILKHPYRKPKDHNNIKSEPVTEKSKRTEAHIAIRKIFDSKLETATLQDEPGVISIRAAPSKGPDHGRSQANRDAANGAFQKGKLGWEELGGEYLHFTLYKENKDTMEVLYFMASQLKVAVKNFQFAGTKDRRGVTVQKVAVFRLHANRIAGLNKMAKGWVAGGFEYKKHGLELGELMGNEFLLTLRNCQIDGANGMEGAARLDQVKQAVSQAAESFRTNGFLNYYGLQRFGTFSTGTHIVGMKMLKGDLEGAIDSILAYPADLLSENQATNGDSSKVPQDDINRAEAIRQWRESGSTNEMTSRMPRRFQAESAIMQYLGKREKNSGRLHQAKDWQGALMQIQRNLRLMYVHAYQSLVWNTVAGRRWEMFGKKVVAGDLVIVGEKDGDDTTVKEEMDEDGEVVVHPAADDSAASASDAFTRARPLTKEEAESGKYDIFDIVLPLPGYDVLYPANEIGKFYEEFMASETGGGLDPHKMRRAWKDVSLSGGYRKMISKPGKGFEAEVREYEGEDEQLVETDLEKLKRKDVGEGAGENGHEVGANGVHEGGKQQQKKIAVVLKFQLGSSQYATMALRELTKGDAMGYKPDYSTVR